MKGFVHAIASFFIIATLVCPATPQTTRNPPQSDVSVGEPASSSVQSAASEEVAEGTARIILNAPTRGRVGELIRFDLTKSEADSVKWLVVPGSMDFESYADGRKAVFSARAPGEYTFIIAAAKGGTVDVIRHTVTIKGPPKEPTTPDLAQWVPYWLYTMQLDKDMALRLAESFEATSERITPLSTPKGIIEATKEANRAALGDSITEWTPLLKKIQSSLINMAKRGELTTPAEHKAVWNAIATGLRKYAE